MVTKTAREFKRNIKEMNKYIDKMPHRTIIDPAEYKERFGFDWLYEQDIVEILDKRIEEKHDLIKMVQYVCPICHSEKWKCPYPINHFYTKSAKWQQCLECTYVGNFAEHHKFYYMKNVYKNVYMKLDN